MFDRRHPALSAILVIGSIFLLPSDTHATSSAPATGRLSAPTLIEAHAYPPYVLDVWTSNEGLPQNSVNAIEQTRDGYLWLATVGGLVRFDGVTFRTLTAGNTPGLQDIRIMALREDRAGALWIGTERAGVFVLRDGVVSTPAWSAALPGRRVRAIHESRDGLLWIGTDAGVARIDGQGRVSTYGSRTPPRRSSADVLALEDGPAGTVWMGSNGVARITGEEIQDLPFPDARDEEDVYAIHEDAAGAIWIGGERGLLRVEAGRLVRVPLPGATQPGPLPVMSLLADPAGGLWIGTRDGMFHRGGGAHAGQGPAAGGDASPGAEIVRYGPESGLSGIGILAMHVDREGSLWIGTAASGLYRLRPRRATAYLPETRPRLSVVPIVGDGGDGVWLGATCGGLWHLRGGVFEHYGVAQGLPKQCLWALHRDPDGTLWAGMKDGGLLQLRGDRFTVLTEDQGLSGRDVSSIVRDRTGALWAGTDGALNRLTPYGTFVSYRLPVQPSNAWFLAERRAGGLWVGTTVGLFQFVNETFTRWSTANGLSNDAVRAVHEDTDGTLWIGTYGGGLNRLKDGRITHYTRANGLFDDVVSRILDDGRGRLWMSGLRGIFSVTRQELDDVAEGRARMLSCVWYDASDGMLDKETNGGGQSAGWQAADGRLWFPTVAGVVALDPAAPRNMQPPLPAITQVSVDGRVTGAGAARVLTMPPGTHTLRIEYAALTFIQPEKVRYRYRLEGHDADWIEAGPLTSVDYTGLPPGRYRFEVHARNADGVWSTTAAHLPVRQVPYFYQTRWFLALGVLAIFAGGVATQRLRVRRLLRRTQELEARVAARTADVSTQRDVVAATHAQLEAAHDQLTHAHGDLLVVLNHLRLGFAVINRAGTVTFVSDAAQRLTGQTPEASVGRPWQELLPLPAEDRERLDAIIARPAQDRPRLLVHLRRDDGPQFWTQVDVREDPRDASRRFLYFYDVTEVYRSRRILDGKSKLRGLVGDSAAMRIVGLQIVDAAAVDSTVLVDGETGTGKELVARAIHDLSARHQRTFLAVNCAGLTESLLASQLFGHRRGAFTGAVNDQLGVFEAAARGTLFLDEIGDMPPSVQSALLRVLQEKEITRLGESQPRKVDVRVITATHRDLQVEVAAGRFRQDLFYRIWGKRIHLSPLRERREDIPVLVAWFLEHARAAGLTQARDVSREAMDLLLAHPWPGNVRELKTMIENACLGPRAPLIIEPSDLSPELLWPATQGGRTSPPDPDTADLLQPRDRDHVLAALTRARGNRAEASRLLGISRTTLYRRLRELGIETSADAE